MKKVSSVILIMVLVMASTISGFAFTDITETTTGAKEIQAMGEKSYLAGYPDGSFRPEGKITRAEFVTMIDKAKGFEPGVAGVYFTDVPETEWYYSFVKAGLQAGFFVGYPDNTFRPMNNISREEVCVMIAQVEDLRYVVTEAELAKIEIKDEISSYAIPFVKQCIAAGLMDLEDGNTFRAKELATRKDVAVACYRVLEKAGAWNEVPEKELAGGAMGGGAVGGDSTGSGGISAAQEGKLEKLVVCLDEDLVNHEDLNATQKQVLQMVRDGIEEYLENRNYDNVDRNANEAREIYNTLSESQKEQLQNAVTDAAYEHGVSSSDLLDLKEFFF